jgi:hypothetical protein
MIDISILQSSQVATGPKNRSQSLSMCGCQKPLANDISEKNRYGTVSTPERIIIYSWKYIDNSRRGPAYYY